MPNFETIKSMDKIQLAEFLEKVYFLGVKHGEFSEQWQEFVEPPNFPKYLSKTDLSLE
jgi:hypothetical protein